MNSFPTNNYTIPDDANHPSLPFTPRQLGSRDRQAPTFIDDLFSNDLFDLGDLDVNTRVVPTPQVPSHGTLPRHDVNPLFRRRLINVRRKRHIRPGAIPEGSPYQSAGFNASPQANIIAAVAPRLSIDPAYALNTHPSSSLSAGPSSTMFDRDPRCHVRPGMLVPQAPPPLNTLPQSNTHVDLAPQLTIDSTSDPTTHPLASCLSGSSSAAFEKEEQLSFSDFQNVPSMTSGLVPSGLASSSSSSQTLTWTAPITPTSKPDVRPWETNITSMGTAAVAVAAATSTSTSSARAEPQQVPVSRCTSCKRVQPLVRVDDTIEWVRPDVMKMTLYFNWSPNAEAEAHGSWDP